MRARTDLERQISDRQNRVVAIFLEHFSQHEALLGDRFSLADLERDLLIAIPSGWTRSPSKKKLWLAGVKLICDRFRVQLPQEAPKPKTFKRRKPKPVPVAPGHLQIDFAL